MRYLLSLLIYTGIGCAYQSTYDDVNVRQLVTADVPVSVLGHVFAWPLVIVYHAFLHAGWVLVALFVAGALAWLWAQYRKSNAYHLLFGKTWRR